MKKRKEVRLAHQIRKIINKNNPNNCYSINLNKVAEYIGDKIGVKIHLTLKKMSIPESKMNKKIAGYITVENNEISIIVNLKKDASTRRLIIANELGKIALMNKNGEFSISKFSKKCTDELLYYSEKTGGFKRKYVSFVDEPNCETLCGVSAFASELLMPKKIIKKLSNKGYTSLDMANEFNLFRETIERKIQIMRDF